MGARSRALKVAHGFHSPLMAPMLGPLRAEATAVAARAPSVRLVSTVTGAELSSAPDAAHWAVGALSPPAAAADLPAARGCACALWARGGCAGGASGPGVRPVSATRLEAESLVGGARASAPPFVPQRASVLFSGAREQFGRDRL